MHSLNIDNCMHLGIPNIHQNVKYCYHSPSKGQRYSNFFFATYISLIYEFYINGIKHYLICHIKLHLLSGMALRFLHVVECILLMNNQLDEYTEGCLYTFLLKVIRAAAVLSDHE